MDCVFALRVLLLSGYKEIHNFVSSAYMMKLNI